MIRKGIKVHWENSIEFIPLEYDENGKLIEITATYDWYTPEETLYAYNVRFEVVSDIVDRTIVKISYLYEDNSDYSEDDCFWGESTITITENLKTGTLLWKSFDDPKSIEHVKWKKIDRSLIEHKKTAIAIVKQRSNQKQFREALLELDKQCLITNERTKDALEAAHIISSSAGGVECIENGLILRSDIHRLYDSGKFSISSAGKITHIDENISDYYKDVLSSAVLSNAVINRVSEALNMTKEIT